MEFHKRLQEIRKKKGFSVTEMANKISVPISTYREWENGRRISGEKYYSDMAKACGVSLHYLLEGRVGQIDEALECIFFMEERLGQLRSTLISLS